MSSDGFYLLPLLVYVYDVFMLLGTLSFLLLRYAQLYWNSYDVWQHSQSTKEVKFDLLLYDTVNLIT